MIVLTELYSLISKWTKFIVYQYGSKRILWRLLISDLLSLPTIMREDGEILKPHDFLHQPWRLSLHPTQFPNFLDSGSCTSVPDIQCPSMLSFHFLVFEVFNVCTDVLSHHQENCWYVYCSTKGGPQRGVFASGALSLLFSLKVPM